MINRYKIINLNNAHYRAINPWEPLKSGKRVSRDFCLPSEMPASDDLLTPSSRLHINNSGRQSTYQCQLNNYWWLLTLREGLLDGVRRDGLEDVVRRVGRRHPGFLEGVVRVPFVIIRPLDFRTPALVLCGQFFWSFVSHRFSALFGGEALTHSSLELNIEGSIRKEDLTRMSLEESECPCLSLWDFWGRKRRSKCSGMNKIRLEREKLLQETSMEQLKNETTDGFFWRDFPGNKCLKVQHGPHPDDTRRMEDE